MVNFLKKKFASSSETSGADVFNSVDVQMVNKKKKKKKKAKLLDQNHVFGQSLKSQIRSIRTSLLIQEDDATCSNGKRYVIYPKLLWLCLNWLENNADCTDTGWYHYHHQIFTIAECIDDKLKQRVFSD